MTGTAVEGRSAPLWVRKPAPGVLLPPWYYRGQEVVWAALRGQFIGKCVRCSKERGRGKPRGLRANHAHYWNNTPVLECPDCHRLSPVQRVAGRVVESKACNDRCMGATGPSCECACGGENHGAGWLG